MEHPKLRIYTQTTGYTCGPCCLMMVQDRFGDPIAYDTATEHAIWLQTKTGEFSHCTYPRMASYLLGRGYRAELWHSLPELFAQPPHADSELFRQKMKYYRDYKAHAEQQGMRTVVHPFTARDMLAQVDRGKAVVFLCDYVSMEYKKQRARAQCHAEPVLHHRVLYGHTRSGEDSIAHIACAIDGFSAALDSRLDQIIDLPIGKAALVVSK